MVLFYGFILKAGVGGVIISEWLPYKHVNHRFDLSPVLLDQMTRQYTFLFSIGQNKELSNKSRFYQSLMVEEKRVRPITFKSSGFSTIYSA